MLPAALMRKLDAGVGTALRRLEPEMAHRLALRLAPAAAALRPQTTDPAALASTLFGLRWSNPVGVAAGLDKDAAAAEAFLRYGFGAVEVGTVTPKPQPGNPLPRLFRLPGDQAIINRFGFNSRGMDAARRRLASMRRSGIVGINVGANKDSSDRAADYAAGISTLAPHADYITVNVSSPNTPGLRDLQEAKALDDLLARCIEARDTIAAKHGPRPLLLKIAPDLSLDALDDIVTVARSRGVDGMIVSNTTVTRPPTLHEGVTAKETGGLSGRPLFDLSTRMLAETFVRVEGAFPLVGVGGIDSGERAWAKIRAGASLIQLYTALIFKGLGLIDEIKEHLVSQLAAGGHRDLDDVVGVDARDWTARPWPT